MLNQPPNLGKKQTGKPSAGNPHAGFDEAGIGAGPTVALLGHSHEETGSNRSAKPKGTAPILDPTRGWKSPTGKEQRLYSGLESCVVRREAYGEA